MKPKQIPRPNLTSAKELSPLELNDIKFSNKQTVITAEELATLAAQSVQKGAGR